MQHSSHIAESISERLRYTNTVTVKSMQAELTAAKSQIAMGYIMMSIIFKRDLCL
jgi:hypothetical protein